MQQGNAAMERRKARRSPSWAGDLRPNFPENGSTARRATGRVRQSRQRRPALHPPRFREGKDQGAARAPLTKRAAERWLLALPMLHSARLEPGDPMPEKSRVICVGEVMVELARGADNCYGLAFGGDTFNTAVYLARAGIPAAYATALGDDPYSGALMSLAAAENVNADLIMRVPGRMPGLYLIETDEKGERKFYYWRDTSPARELFELAEWPAVAEALLSARLVYFSGVTLSLYSNTWLGPFLAALA